jgi:predicted protein tyrosine phosphatase
MKDTPHILVVCGKNKKRSKTAEHIFRHDQRFEIRSAGVSPKSEHVINATDLHWADLVLVMETDHRNRIWENFGRDLECSIEVLFVPDEYEFMDEELVNLLEEKMNDVVADYFGV